MPDQNETPIPCVGVICFKGEDVLLIKRGQAPRKGDWSIPGGRIEAGESEEAACLRELMEETQITGRLIGKVALIHADFEGRLYDLHDYCAVWESGDVTAGDDAIDAKFVDPETLARIPMWDQTRAVIEQAREMKNAIFLKAQIS